MMSVISALFAAGISRLLGHGPITRRYDDARIEADVARNSISSSEGA